MTHPIDRKARAWAKRNPWFVKDKAKTGVALHTHELIVRGGVDPTSKEYYQIIDWVMRVYSGRKLEVPNAIRK